MNTEPTSQDAQVLELCDVDWLLDHHRTKEPERRQMIADLHFQPGEAILDLGCGPGLWSRLLAAYVQPHGRVVGVDSSAESIAYARHTLEPNPFEASMEFLQADFYSIPFDADTFDATFCGNCLLYVRDPLKMLAEQKRVTKPGGRVIGKETDGSVLMLHPVDPPLLSKVLYATARALADRPPETQFDYIPGRKMHGLFLQVGFQNVTTKTYAIHKLAPLTPTAERYIRGSAEWYGKTGTPYLSEADLQRWQAYLDPNAEQYILDRKEFYYGTVEMVTVGMV